MAVRIPQYTQQVGTPSGSVAGASGRGFNPYEINLSGFASFAEGMKRQAEQNEIDTARAALSAEEPKAQLAFAAKFQEVKNAWTPGSKPIPEQMDEFITSYSADIDTRIPDARARQMIQERANQFKTEYGLKGLAYQNEAEVSSRLSIYDNMYSDWAKIGATDPAKFGQGLAETNAAIMADSSIPESAKAALIQKQSQAAARQVANAQAELNPRLALSTVNAMLGVSEPVLNPTGGDVVAEISKRESGGRLYSADGQILRGPAIRTSGGQTIHAYGKYQLLDSTARQTAKDLGVPWNPEVFYRGKTGDAKQDAETLAYHETLGQAYIQQQAQSFGGNPILIAAAHNMGPEATKGWAAGRPYQTQSGKWWYPKKPMDMAAMPEETRKYVEGLGSVQEVTATADTHGPDAVAYRLLEVDDLLQVRSRAESQLAAEQRARDAQLAVDKTLFTQRLQDIETAAKHGDVVTLPSDQELFTYLGPAQAQLKKIQLLGYQQMAGGLKQLPGLSNAELTAMANMPNPEGTENRENRQFMRDTLSAQAQATLTARKADPGKAALENSADVRNAYAVWQESAAELYGAGQNATPDQLAKMNAAQRNYVTASFAQQRQWGIEQPKLPANVVEGVSSGFARQMETNPTMAAMRMANMPQELGSYDAIKQIGDKTGDIGWFAMEGVPGPVLAQLRQASALKPEETNKLLPTGITRDLVNKEVSKAFAPLMTTFALPDIDGVGDTVTANRYLKAGQALAAQRLISGQSSNPAEAAAAAYQEIFQSRETVNGTYRVPNDFDAEKVDIGLKRRLGNLSESVMYLTTPPPGLTEVEARTNILRNVRKNGRWVTNEDSSGVYLMVAGKPALDAGGRPIMARFSEVVNEPLPAAEREARELQAIRFQRGR